MLKSIYNLHYFVLCSNILPQNEDVICGFKIWDVKYGMFPITSSFKMKLKLVLVLILDFYNLVKC